MTRRYALLAPDLLPATECLKDVVERMLPYWYDAIVGDLRLGRTVLVAAHGNSLRALVKHLDGIGDADDRRASNLPTGVPFRYDLDDSMAPRGAPVHPLDRALGDPEAVKGCGRGGGRARRQGGLTLRSHPGRRPSGRRPKPAPHRAERGHGDSPERAEPGGRPGSSVARPCLGGLEATPCGALLEAPWRGSR